MRFYTPFFAISATFAFNVTASPTNTVGSIIDDPVVTAAKPTMYMAPGFVHTDDPVTAMAGVPPALQARFKKTFSPSKKIQFRCAGTTYGEGGEYRAKASDCEAALSELTTTNGYWDCREWVEEHNLKYYVIFEHGTCKAYAMARVDNPAM